MDKEKNAKVVDLKALFTGKASGMSFDKFDEKVLSWGRKKFGEKYAKALWRNTLLNLTELQLSEDLDKYKFDEHCQMMYDVIFHESPKYADSLLGTKRFETLKFQVDLRQRLRERLFCHLETLKRQGRLPVNSRKGAWATCPLCENSFSADSVPASLKW